MENKYFICSYTADCKSYCDEEFLARVNELKGNNPFHLVENSTGLEYYDRLWNIVKTNDYKMSISHIQIQRQPDKTIFHRRVCDSISFLRKKFLETDLPYMLIIESDVIPPVNLLEELDKDINSLSKEKFWKSLGNDYMPWGILGGLYYTGFHDFSKKDLQKTHHVLSGCTVYKRELIEKYPFRFDEKDLGPFPDALICHDAGKDFSLWNDHDIVCEHREVSPGMRYSKAI